jgi:membrane protein
MDTEKTTAQILKKFFIDLWEVFKNTFIRWNQSGPWRQSAILAYYAIFSLPALLLVVIALVGYFYGQEATSQQLSMRIAEWIGDESAEMIEKTIANVSDTGSTTLAVIIGIGLVLFGATTIFYHLQLSLNRIWGVIPKPKKALLKYAKDRLLSFGLILAVGFLLLVSMLLNSLLAVLGDWINSQWAGAHRPLMLISNYGLSMGATATLFAMMFKFLPDAIIRWRSVWVGGLLTALLFALGQLGLRIYFSNFNPASAYGAAGAMILILIWASYVSMILLFGAEFTRQWANKFGHGIKPKNNATLFSDMHEKYPTFME